MFRKNSSLSFSEKQPSVKGFFSAVLAGIAIVTGVAAVLISYHNKGNAGMLIGSCGIMGFLSSAMGFGFGIGGMLEENCKRIWAVIGLILSFLMLAGLVAVFVIGLLR